MKNAARLIAQPLFHLIRQRRGAAAIEFALIAIPMMVIMIGSIQNIVLSAAKLSLDFAVQNLAYEAANSDALFINSLLTRANFCSRTAFILVDCQSNPSLCFNALQLDPSNALQRPALDCKFPTALSGTQSCCYELIVKYPVPAAFDLWAVLGIFEGAANEPKYIQSIALIYRT